jgi:hypothetical protein
MLGKTVSSKETLYRMFKSIKNYVYNLQFLYFLCCLSHSVHFLYLWCGKCMACEKAAIISYVVIIAKYGIDYYACSKFDCIKCYIKERNKVFWNIVILLLILVIV